MKRHYTLRLIPLLSALAALALLALADNPVPAEIPKHDGKPGAKDKPVKIYIFSGQSNSFGVTALMPTGSQ